MAGNSAAMGTTKSIVWILLVLAFLSNVLYMAGLAALQYACNYDFFPTGLEVVKMPACLWFYWWNFAFTCATLVSIAVTACTRLGLHWSRAFWVGMLTTCLFMNMVACEAFLGWDKFYNISSFWGLARWRTTVAGAIINVIWIIFLMMAVGTEWVWEHGGGHTEDPKHHHEARTWPEVTPGADPQVTSL